MRWSLRSLPPGADITQSSVNVCVLGVDDDPALCLNLCQATVCPGSLLPGLIAGARAPDGESSPSGSVGKSMVASLLFLPLVRPKNFRE